MLHRSFRFLKGNRNDWLRRVGFGGGVGVRERGDSDGNRGWSCGT